MAGRQPQHAGCAADPPAALAAARGHGHRPLLAPPRAHGQAPFGADDHLNLLFDKWQLGPLRILNLVALGVLAIGFGPAPARRLPRLHWLEAMGSASLPVFCAHLVAVLLVLAFYGGSQTARPWWGDALLLGAVFAALYAVARATLWVDARKAARLKARG